MPFIEHGGARVLFLHIPKTGGSAVEGWLSGIAPLHLHAKVSVTFAKATPQHLRFADVRHLFAPGYFSYIFTVVRDPYARLESEYRMRALLAAGQPMGSVPSFSTWLETMLGHARTNPWHLDNHLRPQAEFLGHPVKIFRYEDGLETALRKVSVATGLPFEGHLERPLDSSAFEGEIVWDAADILAVNKAYRADFEHLGYAMRDPGLTVIAGNAGAGS